MGDGRGWRGLRMQINKIAQMEKTRDAVLVELLSRLNARLVWLKKRRHASRESVAGYFPQTRPLASENRDFT